MTARLPAVPAAVPIYSSAGDTRVLAIDLDTAQGGLEAVRRDTAAVTELVRTAGGRVIVDESPSGGRHVYVPFSEPVAFHDARDLALAIATRTPSMDPTPNQNLTDGLIRPPVPPTTAVVTSNYSAHWPTPTSSPPPATPHRCCGTCSTCSPTNSPP